MGWCQFRHRCWTLPTATSCSGSSSPTLKNAWTSSSPSWSLLELVWYTRLQLRHHNGTTMVKTQKPESQHWILQNFGPIFGVLTDFPHRSPFYQWYQLPTTVKLHSTWGGKGPHSRSRRPPWTPVLYTLTRLQRGSSYRLACFRCEYDVWLFSWAKT